MALRNTKSQKKPIAIDCFAGCGGMTEGFKQAGYRVVGAIELDPDAVEVFKLNHPRTHLWNTDIKEVGVRDVLATLNLQKGELDLLGGCPPCQGFSTLRTYNGKRSVNDDRNDLIYDFQRLVLGLLPKHVMMENVPGLKKDHRLAKFQSALEEAGYGVKVKVLNVADYGVPQRRRRLVVLASRVSAVQFALPDERRRTVREAIGALPKPGKSGDPIHDLPENRTEKVMDRIKGIPRDGGSRASLPQKLRLRCHKRSDGFKDVYGRMAWDEPAPTITTGCFNPSKGRFLHPKEHRAITVREAAILQSFPKEYKFPAKYGKVKLAMMIGNALPPSFIMRHARAIRKNGSRPHQLVATQ